MTAGSFPPDSTFQASSRTAVGGFADVGRSVGSSIRFLSAGFRIGASSFPYAESLIKAEASVFHPEFSDGSGFGEQPTRIAAAVILKSVWGKRMAGMIEWGGRRTKTWVVCSMIVQSNV